jgi:hypothetical protein
MVAPFGIINLYGNIALKSILGKKNMIAWIGII